MLIRLIIAANRITFKDQFSQAGTFLQALLLVRIYKNKMQL